MADKPAASHARFRAAQQASTHFDKILNASAAASQKSLASDSLRLHPSLTSQSQSQVQVQVQVQASTLAPSPIHSLFNNTRPSAIESRTMAANFPHSDSPAVAQPAKAAPAPPKASNRLDISNLMSPPENLLETFNQAKARRQESKTLNEMTSVLATMSANSGRSASVSDKLPLPMSPPISPYTKSASSSASSADNADNTPSTPLSSTIQDPVLYPIDESSPSGLPQPPLFAPVEDEDTHMQIVDDHVRALKSTANLFTVVPPPRREDYNLMISIKSQIMKNYNSNPRAWLRKERAYLIADREAAMGARRLPPLQPAKPIAAKPARSQRADRVLDRVTSRVSKPHAPRPIRSSGGPNPAAAAASAALISPLAAARSTAGRRRPSATPEPSRRIVAPSREDKNFLMLRDFSPPLSTLSDRAAAQLKPDWKGQPIDLSNDPNRKLLHPAELNLASGLRLDCATYLTSKRRMFMRRLERFQNGKEFRKTDAQQACKIDVNKASRLWVVFNNAGWLEPHWMVPFKEVKIESTIR